MSAIQWGLIVLRALELTGDATLGYEYGLRMRPTVHGVFGYAAMSSTSLRQAVDLTIRYIRVRQAHFEFRYVENRKQGRLELREKFPIPAARSFFIENILLGLLRAIAVLLGREPLELKEAELWFDWPEPPYFRDLLLRERLPPVQFERSCNALCFPVDYLSLRPVLADPHASRQAVELCERELAQLTDREPEIIPRVRAELAPGPHGGYPALETVAGRLNLSSRSPKRRFVSSTQGTSFLLLLEEARLRDARDFLEHGDLSVQDVAARLGYRNPANFSRAFQRWTGQPPTVWRQGRKRQLHPG